MSVEHILDYYLGTDEEKREKYCLSLELVTVIRPKIYFSGII